MPWCFQKKGVSGNCFGAPSNASAVPSAASPPFSAAEVGQFQQYFNANINIQGKGGIVAAPDHNTPGGSYYFHWERDGALTINSLIRTASSYASVAPTVESYVRERETEEERSAGAGCGVWGVEGGGWRTGVAGFVDEVAAVQGSPCMARRNDGSKALPPSRARCCAFACCSRLCTLSDTSTVNLLLLSSSSSSLPSSSPPSFTLVSLSSPVTRGGC